VAERIGEDRVRYLDLESPADRARLADPVAYLEAQAGRLVILDEIHRTPDLFAVLRGIVDRRRRQGARTAQFLVLGSASLDLLRQSAESLAGRITFVELTPVRVDEVAGDRQTVLWVRGGFPRQPPCQGRSSQLGLTTYDDLLGHPVAGPSWEGMVLESLIGAAGGAPAFFYRTSAGAEVDLVIEGRGGRRYAVEVKRSTAPALTKGFWNACDDLAVSEAIVAYSGTERFRVGSGVDALGLHDAVQWVRERPNDHAQGQP